MVEIVVYYTCKCNKNISSTTCGMNEKEVYPELGKCRWCGEKKKAVKVERVINEGKKLIKKDITAEGIK